MKTLLIMRHAKSSWDNPDHSDFERPLNKRGERDAPRVGAWLKNHGYDPEAIICSPSRRTSQTAQLVVEALGLPAARIHYDPQIYEALLPTLMALIRALDNGWKQVLLIGHNPGMIELAKSLGDTYLESFPTCSLAILDIDIEAWEDIESASGRTVHLVSPKKM